MKTFHIIIALILGVSVSTMAQKKEINIEESTVNWTGNKIGGSHNGDIQIKSGYIVFNDGQIDSGEILMDMNSITCLDLENEGTNQKLVGHLKSNDFFGVEKYPTAKFLVTKSTKFSQGKATVTGEITIKGNTENLSFEVVKKGDEYKAKVEIDRSKFDVRFGSKSFFKNIGDKAIDDIFILDISLSLK